jgi:DNA-binding MarR family transcriptional regulator
MITPDEILQLKKGWNDWKPIRDRAAEHNTRTQSRTEAAIKSVYESMGNGKWTVQSLANHLNMNASTVHTYLNKLKERELVERNEFKQPHFYWRVK